MKLIIDIPEETYEALVINQYCGSKSNLENMIVNGTPLPKGHGRLIDISPYEKFYNPSIVYETENDVHEKYINTIPTIIEAEGSDAE